MNVLLVNDTEKYKSNGIFKVYHIDDLDDICDGECSNIYLQDDLINYFPYCQLYIFLYNILQKVSITGSITVSGVDIELLAKDIIHNNIKEELNNIILSLNNATRWIEIRDYFLMNGFKIKRVELNGPYFIVEAENDQNNL